MAKLRCWWHGKILNLVVYFNFTTTKFGAATQYMQRGIWIAWKLVCMVDMLDLVTYLNQIPIFECMWLDVNPRTDTKEDTCFNEI